MKKLLNIFILSTIILILNSCAKPTVVEIVQPNDDKLNCEELKTEIAEVQKIKEYELQQIGEAEINHFRRSLPP